MITSHHTRTLINHSWIKLRLNLTRLLFDDSHIDSSFGELESGGDPDDASSDDDCTPGSAESFLVIRGPIQTLISQIKGNHRTDANTGK